MIEQTNNTDIYLSEDELILGHMDDAILKEIKLCDLFLLLYSKDSHASHYVQHEVGAARSCNKTIVALLLDENVRPDAMIKNIQYLPIYSPDKVAIEYEKLTQYINQQVEIQNQQITQITQQDAQDTANAALVALGAIAAAILIMYLIYKNNEN
jgi:hypothetical protein